MDWWAWKPIDNGVEKRTGGKEVEIWLLRFAVNLDRKIRYEVKDDVNYLKVEFSVCFTMDVTISRLYFSGKDPVDKENWCLDRGKIIIKGVVFSVGSER